MQLDSLAHIKSTLAEIQVTYSNTIPKDKRIKIQSSSDAEQILREIWDDDTLEYREQFYVLYLSRSNQILGYFLHSIGGLSGTIVDVKQILAVALKTNASSIILSHCHPSGNTRPSNADKTITQKIVSGASLLDVTVLDHIILTKQSFYSFADDGMLPSTSSNIEQKVKGIRKALSWG